MADTIDTKKFIYVIAMLAALADSFLTPFYPQFFKSVFKEDMLSVTGIYIAVCRLAMMCSFPFWSWLSKRIPPVKILSVTQDLAAAACMGGAFSPNIKTFFVLTLIAELLKSSYLLMYPYLIQISGKTKRSAVISAISLILNTAVVISAIAGAYIFEYFNPRYILFTVGILDLLQMMISRYILTVKQEVEVNEKTEQQKIKATQEYGLNSKRDFIYVGVITLLFYFSMVIIRPYFTQFIMDKSRHTLSILQAGIIFIVPNIVALGIAPFTARFSTQQHIKKYLLIAAGLMLTGIALQVHYPDNTVLVAGRVIYGTGMFISEVGIDLIVFSLCSSENLFRYYSYISIIQNIAIFSAPLCGGILISTYGHTSLFAVAFAGTVLIALLFFILWRKQSTQVISPDREENFKTIPVVETIN